MELIQNLNNNLSEDININNLQNNFLKSNIGQIANTAIDIGIKSLMPEFIENEVIDVKVLNMLSIFVTLLVLNELKFKDVNDVQLENICCIFVTLLVSNELKSNEVIDVKELNMQSIFVTLLVLNELKSKLVNTVRLQNIYELSSFK